MILAVSGMCDYKYQIAGSQTIINLKELQEVYIASWSGLKCMVKSKALQDTGHRNVSEGAS